MIFLTKIIVRLLLMLVIVFTAAVHAKELEIGMPIFAASKLIINKGWRPATVKIKILPNTEIEKSFQNAHIIEVESCAMDRPSCIFNYKKGNKCLRLFTQGEEIKDMRVSYWTYDCPSESIKTQNQTQKYRDGKEFEMGKPFLDNEKPFLVVRKLLSSKGWTPINVHTGDNYKYDDKAGKLVNMHVVEIESCGIDLQDCIFNYKKGKVCLRIFAEGEEIKDMRVHYWTFDCPDSD